MCRSAGGIEFTHPSPCRAPITDRHGRAARSTGRPQSSRTLQAKLIFSLVSSRYEDASLLVTSNKPFSAGGESFGDEVVAAAMIDRLVHDAEILSLKGDS
jgi:hypothetical protein